MNSGRRQQDSFYPYFQQFEIHCVALSGLIDITVIIIEIQEKICNFEEL